jgi:biopolymer transport protein ExbD
MISGGSTGGRRKSLDAEVNLVPFIDLLSMCICFLLMTAVWVQIGTLQVKQSHGTEAPAADKKTYDVDVKFKSATVLVVQLKQGGKIAREIKATGATPEAMMETLRPQFASMVASVGHALPAPGAPAPALGQPVALQQTIVAGMITPAVGVNYGELVNVMDMLRKNHISNLGVTPVKGN